MKQHLLPSFKLTGLAFLLLVVAYAFIIWLVAQVAPNRGKGETISVNGKIVGFAKEGQNFTWDQYFHGRPSAVNYNAAASGGSNRGPSNPGYLQTVKARIDTFLTHNPGIPRPQIPSELVTASGSGLDPDISPEAALVQVNRIATLRGIPESALKKLVNKQVEPPLAGMFGTAKINVLKLNIALDQLK